MPVQLKKGAVAPLLGTLHGKVRSVVPRIRAPRSSQAALVTVSSDEDVEREPVTSSDDDKIQPLPSDTHVRNVSSPAGRGRTVSQSTISRENGVQGRGSTAGAKRKRDRSPVKAEDEDEAIFGSTWSSQRSQKGYGRRAKIPHNIHAVPSSNDTATSSKSTAKNGLCFMFLSQASYDTDVVQVVASCRSKSREAFRSKALKSSGLYSNVLARRHKTRHMMRKTARWCIAMDEQGTPPSPVRPSRFRPQAPNPGTRARRPD